MASRKPLIIHITQQMIDQAKNNPKITSMVSSPGTYKRDWKIRRWVNQATGESFNERAMDNTRTGLTQYQREAMAKVIKRDLAKPREGIRRRPKKTNDIMFLARGQAPFNVRKVKVPLPNEVGVYDMGLDHGYRRIRFVGARASDIRVYLKTLKPNSRVMIDAYGTFEYPPGTGKIRRDALTIMPTTRAGDAWHGEPWSKMLQALGQFQTVENFTVRYKEPRSKNK